MPTTGYSPDERRGRKTPTCKAGRTPLPRRSPRLHPQIGVGNGAVVALPSVNQVCPLSSRSKSSLRVPATPSVCETVETHLPQSGEAERKTSRRHRRTPVSSSQILRRSPRFLLGGDPDEEVSPEVAQKGGSRSAPPLKIRKSNPTPLLRRSSRRIGNGVNTACSTKSQVCLTGSKSVLVSPKILSFAEVEKTRLPQSAESPGEMDRSCRGRRGSMSGSKSLRRSPRFQNLCRHLDERVSPLVTQKWVFHCKEKENNGLVDRSPESGMGVPEEARGRGLKSSTLDNVEHSGSKGESDMTNNLQLTGGQSAAAKVVKWSSKLGVLGGIEDGRGNRNDTCVEKTPSRNVEESKRRKIDGMDGRNDGFIDCGDNAGETYGSLNEFGGLGLNVESEMELAGRNSSRELSLLNAANTPRKMDTGSNSLGEMQCNMVMGKEEKRTCVLSTPKEGLEEKRKEIWNGKYVKTHNKADESCELQEWTNEQDKALHQAYLRAKPSPHFWKKVSKMVPGKSAKECFDRIHSNHITPPVPQPRSRTNKINQSPVSHFNLTDTSPTGFFKENVNKFRSTKQRKLLAQKTVRHILRKHSLVNRGDEADLFPIFEARINPSKDMTNFNGFPRMSSEKLPTVHKALPTRFKTPDKQMKPSPEVLKQVKNLALHEKYIDQLHCREVRRRNSAKTTISMKGKESIALKPCMVKAAKNALLSEAREVMTQFHHKATLSSCLDPDDDDNSDGSDESEYGDA